MGVQVTPAEGPGPTRLPVTLARAPAGATRAHQLKPGSDGLGPRSSGRCWLAGLNIPGLNNG